MRHLPPCCQALLVGLAACLLGCGGGSRVDVERDVPIGQPFTLGYSQPRADAHGSMGSLWIDVLAGDYWRYTAAARRIVAMEAGALEFLASRIDDRRYEHGQPVAVAQALIGQICRALDTDALHGVLDHTAPVVRFEATRELGRRCDRRSVDALARLERDPNPRVRRVAVAARRACLESP